MFLTSARGQCKFHLKRRILILRIYWPNMHMCLCACLRCAEVHMCIPQLRICAYLRSSSAFDSVYDRFDTAENTLERSRTKHEYMCLGREKRARYERECKTPIKWKRTNKKVYTKRTVKMQHEGNERSNYITQDSASPRNGSGRKKKGPRRPPDYSAENPKHGRSRTWRLSARARK